MDLATAGVVLAVVLCLQTTSLNAQGFLCGPRLESTPQEIQCMYGEYRFPSNFDVSKLPLDVRSLLIARHSSTNEFNVVESDFVPFPYLVNLHAVSLSFFHMAPQHPRFPLNGLLGENKAYLRRLTLNEVKLLDLTEADFNGFNQLESLSITKCAVTSIDLATFNGLGLLPSGLPVEGYSSSLSYLSIDEKAKAFKSLDWSFLAPVASSLETLILQLQPGKLTRSTAFTLDRAWHVQFNDNQLDRVPTEIYTTLNGELIRLLSFAGQRYCKASQERNCGCCEIKGFVDWLRDNQKGSALITPLECGANPAWNVTAKEVLEVPDLHSHCAAPPQVTSTARPQPPANTTPAQPVGPACHDGFVVHCARGVVSAPAIEIDDVDATCAQFIGDGGHRCRMLSVILHEFILEESGTGRKKRSLSDGVVASCSGRGVVQVNEHDPDVLISTEVTVQTSNTAKCRDFFHRFLEQLFGLYQ